MRRFEEKTDSIRNKLEAKCSQMEFSRQKIVAHKQQKNGEADTLTNWFQVINYKQRRHQAEEGGGGWGAVEVTFSGQIRSDSK